jgi:hypothetical protein
MNWLRRNTLCDHPTRRRESRRPQLEDLEGRQLLSTIAGQQYGAPSIAPAHVQPAGDLAVQADAKGAQPAILFPVFAQVSIGGSTVERGSESPQSAHLFPVFSQVSIGASPVQGAAGGVQPAILFPVFAQAR